MKKKLSGFTLLEVMIVLVIMATLTVLSSQAIQQAIKSKIKLQDQIDDVSQVRDSLKVIERDINLAFHYTDLETELRDLVKKKRSEMCQTPGSASGTGNPVSVSGPKPGCDPNDPNDPFNKKPENRVDPTTHFLGKENEIYFATLNASRLDEAVAQADFIKVAYLTQSCKKTGQDSGTVNCLVRRSANIVEGDITKGGEDVVLLEDVTEFKLRYYAKGKDDWVTDWDDVKGEGLVKGRFPDAVEVSLTVEKGKDEKKKKISMQIVVPIRFTNNTFQDNQNKASAPPQGGGN
jgi:prepilin-type N-terminal cleavage/methylation domain-containing protein